MRNSPRSTVSDEFRFPTQTRVRRNPAPDEIHSPMPSRVGRHPPKEDSS